MENEKEYIESLENLLIYLSESYMEVLDRLLELNHSEGNKAYLKVPTIQGSANRLSIRQLGNLEYKKPTYNYRDILKIIVEKRE